MKKNLLIFVGILLIVVPWVDFGSLSNSLLGSGGRSSTSQYSRPNPEFSFWEKQMCFGYRRAMNCPDVPLHPIEEVRKRNGWKTSTAKTPRRSITMNINDIPGSSFK